jgi:periplasmic copper chaperone A
MTVYVRALACMALWFAGSAQAEPPALTEAWIRATPPGARTAAAYLTITSTGEADRLLEAASSAARSVEIHTHVAEGGLQRMVQLAELTLPAGATVRLAPGGLHLMLVDVAAPLTPGMSVPLSLRFAAAGTIVVDVPVVDARGKSPPEHGAH